MYNVKEPKEIRKDVSSRSKEYNRKNKKLGVEFQKIKRDNCKSKKKLKDMKPLLFTTFHFFSNLL